MGVMADMLGRRAAILISSLLWWAPRFAAAALLGFLLIASGASRSHTAFTVLTIVLLISISGVIAMLIPYATEIYPVQVRGTGSGVIAGASKLGGIVAAGLSVTGFFAAVAASAIGVAVPLAVSAVILAMKGVENARP